MSITNCLASGKVTTAARLLPRRHRRQIPSTRSLSGRALKVRQVRVQDAAKHHHRVATVYESTDSSSWTTVKKEKLGDDLSTEQESVKNDLLTAVQDHVITYFLPARYPESVAPGYAHFAGYCFCASIAGSAAMVLSTQTLLLAVGVVGSSGQASIMAGALNWVLKDGIGQLGGVWFASRMSQAGNAKFDADPKRWRMVAAMSLDAATLLEIVSPLVPSVWVLPIASIANVGKNIGFLTASASRAALHQSLAIRGNLADVTAKSGSQTLVASLFGTAIGIGISPILGDVLHFSLGFVCLSGIHQGCNYLALKAVPLCNLNRRRLNIILEEFVENEVLLAPSQVAEKENFVPLISNDESKKWLSIGSPLTEMCPGGPEQLRHLLDVLQNEKYFINVVNGRIHLVYHQQGTTGDDLIRGLLHAHVLHQRYAGDEPTEAISLSYHVVRENIAALLEGMHKVGWKTATEFTSIESSKARRFAVMES